MIFIITPFLQDFKECCRIRNISIDFNPQVKWIREWTQFLGFKIAKEDEIIFGVHFNKFIEKEQNNINAEIEIRKKFA